MICDTYTAYIMIRGDMILNETKTVIIITGRICVLYILHATYVMSVMTVRHRQCKTSIIFGRTAGNIRDRVHNVLKTLIGY